MVSSNLLIEGSSFLKKIYKDATNSYLNLNLETYNYDNDNLILFINCSSEKPIFITDFYLELEKNISYCLKGVPIQIPGIYDSSVSGIDQIDSNLFECYPLFINCIDIVPGYGGCFRVVFTRTNFKLVENIKKTSLIMKLGNISIKFDINELISEVLPLKSYLKTRTYSYNFDFPSCED